MNEAQFLISLGLKPAPRPAPGLCAPAILKYDRGLVEVYDAEEGGTVKVPRTR